MAKFNFIKTKINGVIIIEPTVFKDERGYFMETYNALEFKNNGINVDFVQDNQSKSRLGVLRGMHFQTEHPQDKLVRVTKGEVYDVAVDIDPKSDTYGQYVGVILSEDNKRQLFVPKGMAHGYLVLSEEAEFCYKCSDFYDPKSEGGIMWNDPFIGIEWPKIAGEYILSEKDQNYLFLGKTNNE